MNRPIGMRRVRFRKTNNKNTLWVYVQYTGWGKKGKPFYHVDIVQLPKWVEALISMSLMLGYGDPRIGPMLTSTQFYIPMNYFDQFEEKP